MISEALKKRNRAVQLEQLWSGYFLHSRWVKNSGCRLRRFSFGVLIRRRQTDREET
jgi:hypothetical protein